MTAELDTREGGEALLAIVSRRGADLQAEAWPPVADLAAEWGLEEETADIAVRLLDIMRQYSEASPVNVINSWIEQLITSIQRPCIVWLAQHFTTIPQEQQDSLITHIQQILQQESVSKEESDRLNQFFSDLKPNVINMPAMQALLQVVFGIVGQRHTASGSYLVNVFPVIAKLISYGPPVEAGQMLASLFTNTIDNPNRYSWLHGHMVNRWPQPQVQSQPYNPQQIFDQSHNFITENSDERLASLVLRSMDSMIERGVVNEGNEEKLVQSAYQIWPHHRKESLAIFEKIESLSDTDVIGGLASSIDFDDEDQVADLTTAWSHMVTPLDAPHRAAVTKNILSRPPQGMELEVDRGLRLWLDLQPDQQDALGNILLATDINDEQRKRMWLQAERRIHDLGRDFCLTAIPDALVLPDSPATVSAVLDSESLITELFPNTSNRHRLGSALLQGFVAAPSLQTKNRIAAWLKRLNVPSVLNDLGKDENPSEEDVRILVEHFGKSRYLQKWVA